jgi:hypothetical protein
MSPRNPKRPFRLARRSSLHRIVSISQRQLRSRRGMQDMHRLLAGRRSFEDARRRLYRKSSLAESQPSNSDKNGVRS